jgi:hypothetical protein
MEDETGGATKLFDDLETSAHEQKYQRILRKSAQSFRLHNQQAEYKLKARKRN